jgi:Fe-S-cluster containining protein
MGREATTAATCRSCGACCLGWDHDEPFVDLDEADKKRLGARRVRLHVVKNGCAESLTGRMKTQQTGPLQGGEVYACVYLAGNVFAAVKCRAYDVRPKACREFAPGSEACHEVRRMWLDAASTA